MTRLSRVLTHLFVIFAVATLAHADEISLSELPPELLTPNGLEFELNGLASGPFCPAVPPKAQAPEKFAEVTVPDSPYWLNCIDGVTKDRHQLPRKQLLNMSSSLSPTVKNYVEGFFERYGQLTLLNGRKKVIQGSGTWF